MIIKIKYMIPINWCDSRISLKGKEVHAIYGQQYACTSRKCKSTHCITFQTNREVTKEVHNEN